jgi:hypothetical protein
MIEITNKGNGRKEIINKAHVVRITINDDGFCTMLVGTGTNVVWLTLVETYDEVKANLWGKSELK